MNSSKKYTCAIACSANILGDKWNLLILRDIILHKKSRFKEFMSSKEKIATNVLTKKLTILQRPHAEENLMLFCYNYRADENLLSDYLASQWIKDYTLAACKYMLGEARSKFATVAGPQGGTSLNGDALKAEAQQEMDKLEQDLSLQAAGGVGYGFLIG